MEKSSGPSCRSHQHQSCLRISSTIPVFLFHFSGRTAQALKLWSALRFWFHAPPDFNACLCSAYMNKQSETLGSPHFNELPPASWTVAAGCLTTLLQGWSRWFSSPAVASLEHERAHELPSGAEQLPTPYIPFPTFYHVQLAHIAGTCFKYFLQCH